MVREEGREEEIALRVEVHVQYTRNYMYIVHMYIYTHTLLTMKLLMGAFWFGPTSDSSEDRSRSRAFRYSSHAVS